MVTQRSQQDRGKKPEAKSLKKLENKVALITGASSGIGEAIARVFAAEGAKLALAARSFDKLDLLARSLATAAIPLRADLSDRAQVVEMVRATIQRFGRLDILVNNAAIGMYASVAEMAPQDFQHLVAVNWLGPVYAIQAALPQMQQQGAGQIINISSVAGKVAIPWMSAYCGTKFALNALSDSLRLELRSKNIQVISVCPGRVRTPFTENAIKGSGARPLFPGGISAERVARAVLRASLGGKRQIVVPATNWGFVWLRTLFPGFIDSMMLRVLRRGMRRP